MSDSHSARVLLLRHGEIASHRGDVPLTQHGRDLAVRTGKVLGAAYSQSITVLFGGTFRCRQTAEAILDGIGDTPDVSGPVDAFALRNPDIYVSGTRVNMVTSPAALTEQVPGLTEEDANVNEFFAEFMPSSDRVGWWLAHPSPPGDTADVVADRIEAFARSLTDPGPLRGRLVVGVTHSPVLRAVLRRATGQDPGEPPYVTGAELVIGKDRRVAVKQYEPSPH